VEVIKAQEWPRLGLMPTAVTRARPPFPTFRFSGTRTPVQDWRYRSFTVLSANAKPVLDLRAPT
jgi:hypothetical protein